MKKGKSDGYDGLTSDYLLNGTPLLFHYLSLLFTGILKHGYAPNSFCVSTVIPIPKGSNRNTAEIKDYRGIALSSLLGKLFDHCLISSQQISLRTDDLQFAYKSGASTIQCVSVIQEVINYYINNSSHVVMCMLDASKAFDRVNLFTLFHKLRQRKMCPIYLKVLINMYRSQVVRVNWNGCESSGFSVNTGVKQGGVLSPLLFTVYLDDLLKELREAGIGCHMNGMFTGAFIYADDITLLAPSRQSISHMLSICDSYAIKHNIMFNPTKSKCIMFCKCSKPCVPYSVYFKGEVVNFVESCKLLGVSLSRDINDRLIKQTINSFYRKSNEVMLDFGSLSSDVKSSLFSTYCLDVYGSNIWNYSSRSVQTFFTAWRKVVRRLWSLPYTTHCEYLPIINSSDTIEFALEKRCIKFIWSCLNSANATVKSVVSSSIISPFSVLGENYRLFTSKYNLYKEVWYGDYWKLMRCITYCYSNNALKFGYFIRDLCSIRDFGKCTILTSTEISFLIEYICTI